MLSRTPYDRFTEQEMILRDHLAVDRTILANERTLLSYVRTALGLVAAGFTLLHFFEGTGPTLLGVLLVLLGGVAVGIGLIRYRRVDQRIQQLYHPVKNRDSGQP